MVMLVRRGNIEARLSPRLAKTLQDFRDSFNGAVCVVASSECGRYALVLSIPAALTDPTASEPPDDTTWDCRTGAGFSIMDEAVLGGPLPLH
jgi:hypothetical protein